MLAAVVGLENSVSAVAFDPSWHRSVARRVVCVPVGGNEGGHLSAPQCTQMCVVQCMPAKLDHNARACAWYNAGLQSTADSLTHTQAPHAKPAAVGLRVGLETVRLLGLAGCVGLKAAMGSSSYVWLLPARLCSASTADSYAYLLKPIKH